MGWEHCSWNLYLSCAVVSIQYLASFTLPLLSCYNPTNDTGDARSLTQSWWRELLLPAVLLDIQMKLLILIFLWIVDTVSECWTDFADKSRRHQPAGYSDRELSLFWNIFETKTHFPEWRDDSSADRFATSAFFFLWRKRELCLTCRETEFC